MTDLKQIQLTAEARKVGRHNSRHLRSHKMIPAVVYGPALKENLNICIPHGEAIKYSAHGFENTIFTLKSDDKKIDGVKVLKKDWTNHPLTRDPTHFDFFAPDMMQKVRVEVEIKFVGKSQGEKDGGVFNAVRRVVEIDCLPEEIPEVFEINIEHLNIGDNLHVSDLNLPSGTELVTAADLTLATVAEVREEAATPAAAEPGAEGAEAAAASDGQAKAAGEKAEKKDS